MKQFTVALALLGLWLATPISPAAADDWRVGQLVISNVWARATPGMAKTGAAYLMIANHGTAVDRLVAVATPAAAKAQLHTHLMENDVMKMRPVSAIEVDPGEPAVLRPGGMHVMLMGLTAPLRAGDVFPLTLSFETAGKVEVHVHVMKIGAMGPGEHGHDGHDHGPAMHEHGDHHPGMHGEHHHGM